LSICEIFVLSAQTRAMPMIFDRF